MSFKAPDQVAFVKIWYVNVHMYPVLPVSLGSPDLTTWPGTERCICTLVIPTRSVSCIRGIDSAPLCFRTEFIKKEQDLQMAREQGLQRTYRVDMKRLTVLPPKINNFDPR